MMGPRVAATRLHDDVQAMEDYVLHLTALARGTTDEVSRRRLEATRDLLSSYVLAARDLDDAGVDLHRRGALLERGWHEARLVLDGVNGGATG